MPMAGLSASDHGATRHRNAAPAHAATVYSSTAGRSRTSTGCLPDMASLLDAGGRDQRRVVPQAQAIGQVVAGHGRERHARHQGAQPRQALRGLDVDDQADRATFAQSGGAALQPGPEASSSPMTTNGRRPGASITRRATVPGVSLALRTGSIAASSARVAGTWGVGMDGRAGALARGWRFRAS